MWEGNISLIASIVNHYASSQRRIRKRFAKSPGDPFTSPYLNEEAGTDTSIYAVRFVRCNTRCRGALIRCCVGFSFYYLVLHWKSIYILGSTINQSMNGDIMDGSTHCHRLRPRLPYQTQSSPHRHCLVLSPPCSLSKHLIEAKLAVSPSLRLPSHLLNSYTPW